MRARTAYFFGHRFLRLKNPAQAAKMWATAAADAEPASAMARLARRDLELLKTNQGWLAIDTNTPEPVAVAVSPAQGPPQTVTVQSHAELTLPAGDYTLAVADRSEEYRLSPQQVSLVAGGGRRVKLTWLWQPPAEGTSLPGLLSEPASAAASGRWQVYYRNSRLPVTTAAWSPDGRWIALGTQDGLIRLVDPGTLETVKLLPGRSDAAATIVWSPDATRLAALDGGREVRVYSVETGSVQLILAGSGMIFCSQWSPTADVLVSGGQDRTIQWWRSGQPSTSTPAPYEIRAVAFSPDGQLLATTGWTEEGGHVIDIWETAKGRNVQRLQVGPSPCELLAWSPDGVRLAAATATDAVEIFSRGETPAGPATSPQASAWSRTKTLRGGHGPVKSLVWQADGTRVAAVFSGSGASAWDWARGDAQPIPPSASTICGPPRSVPT